MTGSRWGGARRSGRDAAPDLREKGRRGLTRPLRRLVLLALAGMILILPASAEGTSFSYTYDTWKTSVPVPAPYTADTPVRGAAAFGGTDLLDPTDLYITEDGSVFVLDAGNSRLVVLDSGLQYQREIRLQKDGEPVEFAEALGLFVDRQGRIYVADKKAPGVYVAEPDGTVTDVIGAPPADKVEEGFEYTPAKVLVDSAGIVYVLSANTYSGALQYDQNYEFIGFYGSERVTVTFELLRNRLWKKILSEDAASGLQRNVPTSFINFDIDAENFIYTLKGGTGLDGGQIRKLNPQGTNILLDEQGNVATYGDLETYFDSQSNLTISTVFSDITVDDQGFITALDSTRNRLFQYDQTSNLLYAFGGTGSQAGTFKTPVAVDSLNGNLLVLDSGARSLTVLRPTDFGVNVRAAIALYNDGLYEQAKENWEQILRQDANYELANVGMGKIYEQAGDYDQAMVYYKLGNSRQGYSDAFAAKRDEGFRRNFTWIVLAVVVLLLLMVGIVNYKERHRKSEYGLKVSKWAYPFRCMLHPFKAYYEMKVEKKGSVLLANIILVLFFLVSVINSQLTGFHFNQNRTDRFNVFIPLAMTIGLFAVFVLCNWAVSTLADGEGKFREIWIFTAYALLPYVISLAVLTGLSNAFSLEESAFLGIVQAVAYVWTGANLFMAIREVHQYTAGKTIVVTLISLLGMYLVMLIVTIGYSMFTQLISFIGMIINELRLR